MDMKKILLLLVVLLSVASMRTYAQGCMESSSDEGVTVVGYIQPMYTFKQVDGGDNISSFNFERARFGFVGNIPYDFNYYVMVETSAFMSDNPFLLDAFITYSRFAPWAKISIGQFKSPFSLELNTPCQSLHTVKRSRVVRELATPFRDIGLMISGGNDTSLVQYSLGILNGTGMNVMDNNTKKDIAARLVFHPLKWLRVGGSFRYGESKSKVVDMDDDKKTRYAGEIEVKYKKVLVQGEYIFGKDDGSYTTGGGCGDPLVTHIGSVERNGYWVAAMYMTPWNLQPVIKYESYDPNIDVDKNMEGTLTFGLNVFPNDWTRLQVNYLYSAEETEIENDMFFLQLQVKF